MEYIWISGTLHHKHEKKYLQVPYRLQLLKNSYNKVFLKKNGVFLELFALSYSEID